MRNYRDFFVTKKEGWAVKHNEALMNPQGIEIPIAGLLDGIAEYMDVHNQRYGETVFNDYVLVDGIVKLVEGVRVLLNGETGRLDCGTIDTVLVRWLRDARVEI